jgi:Mor family transcriptional regulator
MGDKPAPHTVELFVTPEGFFQELVQKGMNQRKIKAIPLVENYLVNLLQQYLDAKNLFESEYASESGQKNPKTLAEMYLMAQSAEPAIKTEMLRKLGDRTLYISGFFGDSLRRKVVDIDYYADIGGAAYRTLAHCTREDTLAKVYTTFSKRFLEFVEVLAYISEHSFVKSDESILRLYERYLRTGSALAREKLEEMGVVTLPQDQVKLGKQG